MRPPVLPLKATTHGGFAVIRNGPSDGACGTHPYPCVHPGYDAAAPEGTSVYAPISSIIVGIGDGNSAPYTGYGPYVAELLGRDGYYQLIAHMNPGDLSLGQVVDEGEQIGTVSSANHVHWEVRRKLTPGIGKTNMDNNLDPIAWLTGAYGSGWQWWKWGIVAALAGLGWYSYKKYGADYFLTS